MTLVALLTTIVGSTMLGIGLLRRGFRPRTPAVLLTLMIPALILIIQVTSQASAALPVTFAFGILGHRLAIEPAQAVPAEASVAPRMVGSR